MSAIAVAVLAAAAHAATCPPHAQLSGDPESVTRVGAALAARGVSLEDGGACPVVSARIERNDGGLSLDIVDAAGRSAHRLVTHPQLAVLVVESWARGDLAAPLLRPPSAVPAPPPPAPLQVATAPASFAFAVQGQLSRAADGALEPGVRLGAEVGSGLVRPFVAALISTAQLTPAGLPLAARTSADAVAGARLAFRLGRLRVSPGLGLGAGFVETRRRTSSCQSACTRPVVDDAFSSRRTGLRGEASVALAAALSERWSGVLTLSGLWAPGARDGNVLPSYLRGHDASHLALPAEPAWSLGIAAGLGWGAP